jgi:predicted TIM-barrel fold metal-dependent hydrolase
MTSSSRPAKIIDVHNHVNQADPTGDRLVEKMDALSIETTLVMGVTRIESGSNERALAAVCKHPGRLVGGVCVDPRDGKSAVEKVRRYYGEGFRIVKLFPNMGYFPDDATLLPFFDAVAKLKMGVLSHCGFLAPQAGVAAAYYSQPGRFEKLLRTYKEMPFIFAHMGGIDGFLQTIMLTTRLPNAYTDCSPGQGAWVLDFAGQMAASIPPHKLMWGADSYDLERWLNHNQPALEKIGFAEHLDKIFYSNAKELLVRIGALPAATA